jgi:hypothetical protein
MPVIDLRRVRRVNDKSAWLVGYARNVTSQFGEDGVIERIFQTIGHRTKWCVEFGAWDGKHLSNTHVFMQQAWSGVFIEGDSERFKYLTATYAGNRNAHALCGMVGFDAERNSLDSFLARTPIPKVFDLLSVDIDGNDWHVWQTLTEYRSRVVVIEFNPTIPNDVFFVQDRDPKINQGCSLLALVELAKIKGYELIASTRHNGIFVVAEEFSAFGIEDNSIDALHDDAMAARIFQGYDGTILTANLPQLIWQNHTIHAEDLQVLPRRKRRYVDRASAFHKTRAWLHGRFRKTGAWSALKAARARLRRGPPVA